MVDRVAVEYDQLQCTSQFKDALDLSLNFNCISTSHRTAMYNVGTQRPGTPEMSEAPSLTTKKNLHILFLSSLETPELRALLSHQNTRVRLSEIFINT